MKTKLTLKYSSFFFCNNIQLKKGQETEIETDGLSSKDIVILNAYISSGGIVSSEGLIPVVLEDVVVEEPVPVEEVVKPIEEEVKEVVEEKVEETTEELKEEPKEEAPAKKTTRRTTKKTK
mgnify:CR=1 FL=1